MLEKHVLEAVLKEFCAFRSDMLDKLSAKEIGKDEFIRRNLEFFNNHSYRPRKGELHSIEEGIFNYQYYNSYAKENSSLARELKYKDPFKAKDHRDIALKFYKQKDKETDKMLRFLGYKNIEAYYININSVSLKDSIFEIVLKGYDRVILHSKDEGIKSMLISKHCFRLKPKKSVIDEYINTLY